MSLVTPKVKNITWLQIKTDLNDQSARPSLSADRHYHVRVDGNDANDELADSAGGAFLTIQKAVNVISNLDLNGFNAAVYVGDGTYTTPVTLKNVAGYWGVGCLTIYGHAGSPCSVIISTTNANGIFASGITCTWIIQDVLVTTTTGGSCIYANGGSVLNLTNVFFGASALYHIRCGSTSQVNITGDYTISGNATCHMYASAGGVFSNNPKTITLFGIPAFSSAFVNATQISFIDARSLTFAGAATGKKYNADLNSVLNTVTGNINYFPGNSAGTTATGGQYA